ncbi:Transcriptional regulator, LysR family [Labilithrix luteola]|uniref:Transcriptional regulator, LysR family n=1 Tax=Labilithrix luteola TaxID=1391654 RepID=A0A0K1QEJ6_9BACT|nr:LysR family transcriptional regulator [Labilithrix luteola]AKV03840.1 Transcriptional regulator, LysR family [Labilithrix luteola]
MNDPLENAELLAFTKAVDAQSLTRAAAELGIPRATIGKRLARLEARLGVRLLRRTTRSLLLTDAGESFYRQARIVLDAVSQAEASIRRPGDPISGDLRVSLPPMTGARFLDTIAEFAEAHPAVRLHVFFSSRMIDLRREGYDVALRATEVLEPGLVARTIARTSLVAVASRAYLAEHGEPRRASDLSHHRCLMGFARGELPQTHWPIGKKKVALEGAFFSNSPELLCRLAARGRGIALVPAVAAAGYVERGELVHVMSTLLRVEGRMALVYPERDLVPPQVRAFIDWMVARLPPLFAPGSATQGDARSEEGSAPRPSRPARRRARA